MSSTHQAEACTVKLTPFHVSIPDSTLDELKVLLTLAKLPPPTYEGTHSNFGVTRKWIEEARARWKKEFDWRTCEEKINQHPQWTAAIFDDDGSEYSIHFVGIFSKKKDAIPLVLLHGWPGSFLEFIPLVPFLTASTCPTFHIIIPSLPGYGFSRPPPLDKDFGANDVARIIHKLLLGLGFGAGYAVQGGDLGSLIARILGVKYEAAKIVHLNFCPMDPCENLASDLTEVEKLGLERMRWFHIEESAYVHEHAYRPSTISAVIASNPVALLAWVGEKFLLWTDKTPSMDTILEILTLWWVTETFPTSIYQYRELFSSSLTHSSTSMYLYKPFGYSNFALELMPMPKSWVATTGDLVWYKHHDKGGHFASMEVPDILANDIIEFVRLAWKA